MKTVESRLLKFLLFLFMLSLGLSLFLGTGWYLAERHAPFSIDALSIEERKALTKDLLDLSPGIYDPPIFDEAMGFTLKKNQEITVGGTTEEIPRRPTIPSRIRRRKSFPTRIRPRTTRCPSRR